MITSKWHYATHSYHSELLLKTGKTFVLFLSFFIVVLAKGALSCRSCSKKEERRKEGMHLFLLSFLLVSLCDNSVTAKRAAKCRWKDVTCGINEKLREFGGKVKKIWNTLTQRLYLMLYLLLFVPCMAIKYCNNVLSVFYFMLPR